MAAANVLNRWYTDSMDVYRVVSITVGNIDKKERRLVLSNIPCRIYQTNLANAQMRTTSATTDAQDKISCGVNEDIQTGDELMVSRGKLVGINREPVRYFAGDIQYYYEPIGGLMPLLQHQQIAIFGENRVKGGVPEES